MAASPFVQQVKDYRTRTGVGLKEAVEACREENARRVSEWRIWLSRQLLDPTLTDQRAANIVAFYPSISDEWKAKP